MKIGIFGGTFNPVHNGHLALASCLLRQARLDEVWLMVTPQNPWKVRDDLLDDAQRLMMTQAAVEDIPGLVASDYEFSLPRPSYTWNTLQALIRDFPEHEFTLLVGGDNWARFDQWYEHDKILEHHPIAIYPRKGYKVDRASLPKNVRLLRTRLINVSSTEIRQLVSEGKPISHLVPAKVEEIIRREGFYTTFAHPLQ